MHPFYMLSDRCSERELETVYGEDYSERIAPQRLWYAFKYRHFALMTTTIAAMCAGVLTIVVSGLFRYVVEFIRLQFSFWQFSNMPFRLYQILTVL